MLSSPCSLLFATWLSHILELFSCILLCFVSFSYSCAISMLSFLIVHIDVSLHGIGVGTIDSGITLAAFPEESLTQAYFEAVVDLGGANAPPFGG